ncbi:MAG: hypothetical protein ABH862_07040 [Candidatus Omnitrophota bacterium]
MEKRIKGYFKINEEGSMVYDRTIKGAVRLTMAVLMVTVCITAGAATDGTPTAEEKSAIAKDAKLKLNNTTWEIELKEMSTEKNREEMKDIIRFAEGRISSDKLTKEGFTPTNYTVRIKGKDRLIWETMQTSEEKGIAFWRGELREGQPMRGVLSWHIKENKIKDYSFSSDGTKKWGIVDGVFEAEITEPEPMVVEEAAVAEEIEEVKAVDTETVAEAAIPQKVEEAVEVVVEEVKAPAEPEKKVEEKSKKKDKNKKRGMW